MTQALDRETASRKLLKRLRQAMAEEMAGQKRLDQIAEIIGESMLAEVCSVYLFRDAETLELCATQGLNLEAVHNTRMRLGEGLVGQVAKTQKVINAANAPAERGFRYMPETGEEAFSSFLGVPIQRLGDTLGVLVVQSKAARQFSSDEVYGLEVVAMVLAEMAELGAFVGEDDALPALHQQPVLFRGSTGQEGAADGRILLHEPRVVVTNPIADDPQLEMQRLDDALERLQKDVTYMLAATDASAQEQREILEAYQMFAQSKGWVRRLHDNISLGLSAEAAVEKEQSATRARLSLASDAYLRERLNDLDDLSNRLLRLLTGQGGDRQAEIPVNPVLVARNIGPAELMDYGRSLRGVVLEEGAVGSHAAIVARALAIPLVIQAKKISTEALNGDRVLIDGDNGLVHLRPDEVVINAFADKMAMQAKAQERYASIRELPAKTRCGAHVALFMNAGLMADLPSLRESGAEGVGLFRTELQFLTRARMPSRSELVALYRRVLEAAQDLPVTFRTLDIGSDKVVPYFRKLDEPNPALGWRAVRVALDRPGIMRMQLQALLRAANGKAVDVMFPFVAQHQEFLDAREELNKVIARETRLGHPLPARIRVGAMLETPSLAYAPDCFFEEVDFISVGGNDLKQFFFAADRENEQVRRRYDSLSMPFLSFLSQIVERCAAFDVPLSFCGEDAGRPLEAACLAAIGFRILSMRPASIGPVKHYLRRADLKALRQIIDEERRNGHYSARSALESYFEAQAVIH